jgi:hypothetical protein
MISPFKNKQTNYETLCHNMFGTIKIPPCSKAPSAEHRTKCCNLALAMVASSYGYLKALLKKNP